MTLAVEQKIHSLNGNVTGLLEEAKPFVFGGKQPRRIWESEHYPMAIFEAAALPVEVCPTSKRGVRFEPSGGLLEEVRLVLSG